MFNELIEWPIESDRLHWRAGHVLRDLHGGVQLLFRLTLTGPHFPERGAEPFMTVGGLRSRFVRISPDGLTANGYFDHPPPREGAIEFGYGRRVMLRCRRGFDIRDAALLKKALLPPDVRNLDRFAEVLK